MASTLSSSSWSDTPFSPSLRSSTSGSSTSGGPTPPLTPPIAAASTPRPHRALHCEAADHGIHSYLHHVAQNRTILPSSVTLSIGFERNTPIPPQFRNERFLVWKKISSRFWHLTIDTKHKQVETLINDIEALGRIADITLISGLSWPPHAEIDEPRVDDIVFKSNP